MTPHDHLDRLLDDVHLDADPQGLWTAGARRRTRERLAAAVGTLAVLLLLAGTLVPSWRGPHPMAEPAGATSSTLTFPQRISHQLYVPGLGVGTGRPMAAVVRYALDDGTHRFEVVDPGGTRYRVNSSATVLPALSPDGRHLAVGLGGGSELLLTDLVQQSATSIQTRRATAQESAANGGRTALPLVIPQEAPMFWSPDGTRLALQGPATVIVTAQGQSRTLTTFTSTTAQAPPTDRRLVGWFDDSTLAAVEEGSTETRLLRVDARTEQVLTTTPLQGATGADLGSRAWSLSPDGSTLAQVQPSGRLEVRSTATGAVRWAEGSASSPLDLTPTTNRVIGWSGDVPLVAARDSRAGVVARSAARSRQSSRPVLVSDVEPESVTLAAGAQSPTPHLFGTRTQWWSWWSWEIGAAVAAVITLLLRYRWRGAGGRSRPGRDA